jgi:hypothetical protein
MKAAPLTILGAIVLLCLAGLFLQYRQSTLLQTQLAALAHDRDTMKADLQTLTARLSDLQERVASVAATAAARGSTAATGEASRSDATAVPQPPPPRPGVTTTAPAGWAKNGRKAEMYVAGVDSNETWGGMPSAYVQSLAPTVDNGFGGMMQTTSADNYVGKRVRLSGWIKTENANEGGGHLWLRIDGQERGQTLGFDNMDNRAAKGTTDWQEASIVLDVPSGARALAYGFFVAGGGKMWVNGQRIEEVGPGVPTTNMIATAATPRNLGFDPNHPK